MTNLGILVEALAQRAVGSILRTLKGLVLVKILVISLVISLVTFLVHVQKRHVRVVKIEDML